MGRGAPEGDRREGLRLSTATALSEKGQLSCTCLGSDNFETKFKDHELADGTKALVPLNAGRHRAAQHSDAGSSIDWAEDLCQGRCAGSSEQDVMTRRKKAQKKLHDHKQTPGK